jgi:hypothetical protein
VSNLLWGQGLSSAANLGDLVVRVLAVAGGAFLGGLLTGLVVQLLVRAVALAKVPRRILWVLRVLGTVAGGLVVYWLLFHGSGGAGGWGFGGGWGLGSGTGREGAGEGAGSTGRETATSRDTARTPGSTAPNRTGQLQVEVLGIRNSKPIDDGRFYRLEGEADRHTLDEIERIILQRRAEAPALHKVEVVLYLDSPAEATEPVRALRSWAEQNGLTISIALPPMTAP